MSVRVAEFWVEGVGCAALCAVGIVINAYAVFTLLRKQLPPLPLRRGRDRAAGGGGGGGGCAAGGGGGTTRQRGGRGRHAHAMPPFHKLMLALVIYDLAYVTLVLLWHSGPKFNDYYRGKRGKRERR